jgi:hypothetical protein
MEALTEPEAHAAVVSVLCEPDPTRGAARQRLLPGLRREFLDAHARYLIDRGETDQAAVFALNALRLPLPISSSISWHKAEPEIKLASDICWFLYSAVRNGDDKHATITTACRAWAASHRPGLDPSEAKRYVQKRWRHYRRVAHLCAAFHAFRAEEITGYIDLLAVAESILDCLSVRKGTAPQPLLDRRHAWTVPDHLGLQRVELDITPANISRLIPP